MVHTRNQARGYAFENKLVKEFSDSANGWSARRLGGSSSGLPDVIITNNMTSTLYSVECKSTYGNYAYIQRLQIDRCMDMLDMFSVYENKFVVFAFKFASTKPRTQRYYFFKIQDLQNIRTFKCYSSGRVSTAKLEPLKPASFEYLAYDFFGKFKDNIPLEDILLAC